MISLAEIAEALDCDFYGNGKLVFSSPSEPSSANINQIAIAIDQKFQSELYSTKAKGAIINTTFNWKKTKLEGVIVTNQSKLILSKLTKVFDDLKKENRSINQNSLIIAIKKIYLLMKTSYLCLQIIVYVTKVELKNLIKSIALLRITKLIFLTMLKEMSI